jgi:hypothetical protein
MFFMAELCHIQKDGHCYKNPNPVSWFPLLGKKILEKPQGLLIICFFFHINNQLNFSGNGILANWQHSVIYNKANEACQFKSSYIEI